MMVMEGDYTLVGEHTMQLQMIYYRITHLKHIILLTNLTTINLIK